MRSSMPLTSAFAATQVLDSSLTSRSIDADLLSSFEWMSEYAAAGYCNKDGAVGDIVSCDDSVCIDVYNNGATIVATLSSSFESTGGVVIKDDVNSAIVVSFAGTDKSSILDFTLDFDILLESIGMCDGCKVHAGFHGAWDAMADTVLATVTTVLEENPSYSVSFTGHSLGGAIATFGCAYWRINGGTCELYTFGSPRIGNMAFVEFVSAQEGNEYRITHLDDPIPRLPGHQFGYYHTNMEYWLSDGSTTTVNYNASDVVVCTGFYNTTCNGQGTITTDQTAHSYYLRHISVCS